MKLIHPQGTLEAHELALLFPPMEERDFVELCESVKEHGLRDDIILLDGKVLDGIHRYKACIIEGIKPTFCNYSTEFDGKSPEEFVMDKNFHRRHLTLSQKAAISTQFLVIEEKYAKERQKKTQFKPAPSGTPVPEIVTPIPSDATGPAPVVTTSEAPAPEVPETTGEPEVPEQPENPPPVVPLETAADKKKGGIKGKGGAAAALIAEKFGVSKTMVLLAKRIKKADEELFSEVLNGTKTVNEAITIIDAKEAAAKDTGKKLAEKQARATALEAIGNTYGVDSDVYRRAAGKEILKTPSDLIAFSLMKAKDTKSIIPLLGMGWGLEKAKRYLDGKMTLENSLEEFANMATANGKPKDEAYVVVLGEWTFTVCQAS